MSATADLVGPISTEQWARHRKDAVASLPSELAGKKLPDILLRFQKELLQSTARNALTVAEKSRRTGATWAVAGDAVLHAGAARGAGGMDVFYIGYNLDMAREFIDTAGMWCGLIAKGASEAEEFLFDDGRDERGGSNNIQAFRIRFASGFEIVALSSRPRSLRGRQGYVILDEFAFHDDPDGLLKAAMALLIWGGKVLVISTHNGTENPFNQLIQDIRKGKRPGNIVRCTFDDAIRDGLYQRVCLKLGIDWTAEGEATWREAIRKNYGAHAAEELDCVPTQGTGVYIMRAVAEAAAIEPGPVLRFNSPEGFVLWPKARRETHVDQWLQEAVAPELAKLNPKESHGFGEDFARVGDLTVITPIARSTALMRSVPFVVELRNVPFEEQKRILFFIVDRLPRFHAGKLDKGGNGAYLAEVAMQRYGAERIEQVQFSQGWYLENMPKMKSALDDRALTFVQDAYCVDDIVAIKLVNGVPMVPHGLEMDDRDGGKRHGDFAPSLCLAVAAMLADPISYRGYQSAARSSSIFGEANDDGEFKIRAIESVDRSLFSKGTF